MMTLDITAVPVRP